MTPRQGVYSWTTDGYEEAAGARRSFPEESQRVITTRSRNSWAQHHYFSEEREIWSRFRVSEEGAGMAYQRNKVTFGPVTNDSEVLFSPPMLVGPSSLEVDQAWNGKWSGKTYGSYDARIFEHGPMSIGGERVDVWGIEYHIELQGETEGTVDARAWLAPEYAMPVREDYVQDIKADVGRYHAEWSMTLKSLHPRR